MNIHEDAASCICPSSEKTMGMTTPVAISNQKTAWIISRVLRPYEMGAITIQEIVPWLN